MQQSVLEGDYWDAFYGDGNDWGQPNAGMLETLEELQKAFSMTEIRALDLACGNGRYTVPLALLGARVDCVDFSQTAIAQLSARAREQEVAGLIQTHCGDVRSFQIQPERYHLVLASGLFEYLTETELDALIRQIQSGTMVQGMNTLVWLLQHPEASVIPKEYPVAPGKVENIYAALPGWQIISAQADLKEDFHPVEMGGKPQKHTHYIGRMVAKKISE